MNTSRTLKFASALSLVWLVCALMQSVHAAGYSYQLPDGTLVTMTVQTNQTVLTLTGTAGEKFYRLDATQDLAQWVTLDARFKLNNQGTYTYTDSRVIPKCFYRIMPL
jgi:N-acetylneuraminic acid mutarotase